MQDRNSHTALVPVTPPTSDAPASDAASASPYAAEHMPPHHGAESVSDVHYRTRTGEQANQQANAAPHGHAASHGATATAPTAPGKKVNTLAVVSFAASLLGWSALPFIGTIVAIVTGHIARSEIRRTGEEGDTFAVIGLALSWLQVALAVGTLFVVVLVFGGFAALMAWLGMSGGGTMGTV